MNWFKRKESNSWLPAWTYKVDGVFWRLKISEDGLILCEVRDPEKKQAWFNCIRETNGSIVWEGLQFEEPWWIGFEDVAAGRAYFHTFRKPDMPQHRGITAVDMDNGSVVWQNPEATFLLADGRNVYATAQGFESRKFFLLDEATGEIAQELGAESEAVNILRAAQNEEFLFRNYRYPGHFDASHPEFETHRALVNSMIDPHRLRGNLDVLSIAGLLLISWHETADGHTESAPCLDQRFSAVEIAANSLIYDDTINAGVQAPAVDSFFIKDRQVLYIKERHTLTAHVLPTE